MTEYVFEFIGARAFGFICVGQKHILKPYFGWQHVFLKFGLILWFCISDSSPDERGKVENHLIGMMC